MINIANIIENQDLNYISTSVRNSISRPAEATVCKYVCDCVWDRIDFAILRHTVDYSFEMKLVQSVDNTY
jgi:hypothetical protein